MKKLFSQLGTWLANLALLAILGFNLFRLFGIHARQKLILEGAINNPGSLLTDNPEALLEKIRAADVPLWAWVMNWGGIAITLGLIVSWLVIKRPEHRRVLLMINLIWLGGWLVYFVIMLVRLTYAFANLI